MRTIVVLLLVANLLRQVNASSEWLQWNQDIGDTVADLCTWRDPLMDPFYEVRYGQDVVWQIPTNPKAVLFIGHGADREPLSFFDRSPNCRECYGFPEDRAFVLEALRRKYAVIMVASVAYGWQPHAFETWPAPETQDRLNVVRIVNEWISEHTLEHLPLASYGQSSGGWFSSVLTLDLKLQALVLMCSNVEAPILEHVEEVLFPPILFVPMPADVPFYIQISNTINVLNDKGFVVREIDAWPRAIYPSLFADQIPCLDTNTSANIYNALKADGWLNESDFLVVNPRAGDWRSVLEKSGALPFSARSNDLLLAGHVQQELYVAYGEHSLTSWVNGPLYDWLDSILLGLEAFSAPSNHMTASS